jgi:hypothetical protein
MEWMPAISANSNTILFSWIDSRRFGCDDVYAKIVTWDWEGTATAVDRTVDKEKPQAFRLSRAYPNPFNPETTIEYGLPADGHVHLQIFNATGRLIRTLVREKKPSGTYSVKWDGRDDHGGIVPGGIYLVRMISGDYKNTRKMVLIR